MCCLLLKYVPWIFDIKTDILCVYTEYINQSHWNFDW